MRILQEGGVIKGPVRRPSEQRCHKAIAGGENGQLLATARTEATDGRGCAAQPESDR